MVKEKKVGERDWWGGDLARRPAPWEGLRPPRERDQRLLAGYRLPTLTTCLQL